ncbi:MAG: hypothetical protein GWN67_16100 [Phycisphaerae bacterium]|nr:hypothetical protein [Phycisphaerae bacterium]NIS52705.1 hypothetical protein [Phycisphaerae bacterium]NIU10142.1 hypothetical protein [Phycisphaerae bacterium]NIU57854.1 hypothetical protein [Phycisphaerae bacterium]NIX00038.1 hypothetical protein [Phycisphaerae bacterium]
MSESYYINHGFKGLTGTGKLLFILVFVVTGATIWFFFVKPVLPEEDSLLNYLPSYLWAIIKIVGAGLAAAYIAHFFLPKLKFHKQKFYCAECGEFLGYSIQRCPRAECGSNRYTTDAELAQRRSYKRQTQNHK